MRKKLTITLKSDLCVASGYSYAGIVDSDICYDTYGLPYIPARRLKGCFRDTAENLLYSLIAKDDIIRIFGAAGQKKGGRFRISNAKLKGYGKIVLEIESLRHKKDLKGVFTQQRVLEQYTHIIAQTAIGENDAAENQSLRYTRVINHYIPEETGDGYEETVFEALVDFDAEDENILRMIAGATKNIGLKRNRGFGAVYCELRDCEYEDIERPVLRFDADKEYIITYILENDEPLMLSQLSSIHSGKMVNGQMVLGHLAEKYLESEQADSNSQEFKDLFLNGTTKYTPAYPAVKRDKDCVDIYYPAPLNLNELKVTKEYVDTFFKLPETNIAGNQPKKLKKYFVHEAVDEAGERNRISLKEVDMKLYYHHRKDHMNPDGSKEEGILYPSEAVTPGQLFIGEIYTNGVYAEKLVKLMNGKDFYFGKSKGSEYGHCSCTVNSVKENNTETISVRENDKICVTLLTDALIVADGSYSVDRKDIEKDILEHIVKSIPSARVIEQSTGRMPEDTASRADAEDYTLTVMMETGLVSGYQTSWNMHKPLYPVIKAGSCFLFEAAQCKEGKVPKKIWIGTKNQEGYGYSRVEVLKELPIDKIEVGEDAGAEIAPNTFRQQYIRILRELLLESLIDMAITDKTAFHLKGLSRTQISRAILMLKQCAGFSDFKRRIQSIKTDSVERILDNQLIRPLDHNDKAYVRKLVENRNGEEGESVKAAERYINMLQEAGDTGMNDIWKDYLLYNLTICKYEAKED